MDYFLSKIKGKLNKTASEELSNAKEIIQSFQASTKAFDRQEVNRRIESISDNCNKWSVYILNEPTMGLYYCQIHHKRCIENKAKFLTESQKQISKKEVVATQISRTNQEVKEIGALSGDWFHRIASKLEQLK